MGMFDNQAFYYISSMEIIVVLFMIIGLIAFIVWQIKRAIRMKRAGTLPPMFRPIELKPSNKISSLKGMQIQLLESLEIIQTSKNIDIIIGRYNFSQDLMAMLTISYNDPIYNKQFYIAAEEYKQMYFDKILTSNQTFICKHPSDRKLLDNFYCDNLIRALRVNLAIHNEAISGMKQKNAIVNRYTKIMEISNMVLNELSKLGNDEFTKEHRDFARYTMNQASTKKHFV